MDDDLPLNSDLLLNWETSSNKGMERKSSSTASTHSADGWELPSFADENNSNHQQQPQQQQQQQQQDHASSCGDDASQEQQQCEEQQRQQVQNQRDSSSLAAAVAAGRQVADNNSRDASSPVAVSTTASIASASTKAAAVGSSDHSQTMSTKDAILQLQSNANAAASKHDEATAAFATSHQHHQHHHHHQDANRNDIAQQQQQQNHPSSNNDTGAGTNNTQMHPLAIPSSANCPPHVVGGMSNAMSMPNNGLFSLNFSALGGHHAAFATGNAQGLPPMFYQSQAVGFPDGMAPQRQEQQEQVAQPKQGGEAGRSNNNNPATATTNGTPPPFYLFDAPIELRANYMQSQRMLGLPVTEDSNSYHYGVAVNGFHPEQTHLAPPESSASSSYNASSIQLIDARHGSRKAGRIKNEREQRRAQKITELIEQLREKMEKGGWKVEMKSKFHTLSSCADYVKHLIKLTKEKEEAVNKAKSDLQMKERKVEEEKAMQEARSDPESVMSSLTSSTGESARSSAKKVSSSSTDKSSDEDNGEQQRKRKSQSSAKDNKGNKKSRLSSTSDSFGSSESSGEERGSSSSDGQNISSVSDITESNKGSSNSGSSNQRSDDDDESGTPSSISASSDAAVVQGVDSKHQHVTKHADVVIKGRNSDRRKLPKEVTSLEESFVLDYEEVFLKSNVPQIIATTAGRIVAWNEFFLKATGVTRSDMKGLTIFSLVKPDKLSNLFEIVAKALRKETQQSPPTSSESDSASDTSSQWNYSTMTLPCIDFPQSQAKGEDGKRSSKPLYITVTLMTDDDPRKRLFHCVFTDCPGTNGALGSVTPKLLSLLFTRHRKIDNSEKKSH